MVEMQCVSDALRGKCSVNTQQPSQTLANHYLAVALEHAREELQPESSTPEYSRTHLLGLPAELRNKIWEYVVDEPELQCETFRPTTDTKIFSVLPSWSGAGQCNKQMSTEIKPILTDRLGSEKVVVVFERLLFQGLQEPSGDRWYRFGDADKWEGCENPEHGNNFLVVFEVDKDGSLVKTEQFRWKFVVSATDPPTIGLCPQSFERLEYRLGKRPQQAPQLMWLSRREVPWPLNYPYLFAALDLDPSEWLYQGGDLYPQDMKWRRTTNPYTRRH